MVSVEARPDRIAARVESDLGARAVNWEVVCRGWTKARRWVVSLEDGRRVFVKSAGNALTAAWLRKEAAVYQAIGAAFAPQLLGWMDDPREPILILQDLSDAIWPPPWDEQSVAAVRATLQKINQLRIPLPLPKSVAQRDTLMRWRSVARSPSAFLALNLCDRKWLEAALPRLQEAEAGAQLEGNDLLHGDVKSGNICFLNGRCLLIDWNWCCLGNAKMDIATWLPGLAAEEGPLPQTVLPHEPEMAALVSGYLAYHAGLPPPPEIPALREVQLRKLRFALPWLCHELQLQLPQKFPARSR
jgi:hypothetical protein